jgi:SulP family sulfate permease
VAAGLLAVMVGVLQLLMGVARLGMLVNFVSDSVIVGFTAGAGILILASQLRHLFGLEVSSRGLFDTLQGVVIQLPQTHLPTLAIGLVTVGTILLVQKYAPKWPATPIGLVIASALVFLLGLEQAGVKVIGELPGGLPPLADLPLLDLNQVARLSTGALAIAAIGLIQTVAIARSIAAQTGQRLNSNQEFVGQGLANLACGFCSGYACAGSLSGSAVNKIAGARSPLAAVFAGLLVLIAMSTLASLTAYLPRAALAGMLLVVAYRLIDRNAMLRIWRSARGDALIMLVTLSAMLFLPTEFAILAGILMSLGYYILKTSAPRFMPSYPTRTSGISSTARTNPNARNWASSISTAISISARSATSKTPSMRIWQNTRSSVSCCCACMASTSAISAVFSCWRTLCAPTGSGAETSS